MTPTILNYSEKSFIVIGDSKPYKDNFKIDGKFIGKFNRFLKVKNEKGEVENTVGWVFPNKHLDYISNLLNTTVDPAQNHYEKINLDFIHEKIETSNEQEDLF